MDSLLALLSRHIFILLVAKYLGAMICNTKRKQIVLQFCLGVAVLLSSSSVAFAPSRYHSILSRIYKLTQTDTVHCSDRRVIPNNDRALYASPPQDTQTENGSDNNAPFFLQDMDSAWQAENYDDSMINEESIDSANMMSDNNNMESAKNGNRGGMDAYAQQMQDFSTPTTTIDAESQIPIIDSPPPPQQNEYTSSRTTTTPATSSNTNANDDQAISSVDARVLESILEDGKLNLSTEYEVKKLLDGPRLQEGEEYPGEEYDEEGKYSSKVIKKVSDSKFWNSIRAKGEEIIDQAGIYIANRIERDSKTLAALGIFSIDRIRRDVARALPAAGRATRKLLLATNSSAAEMFLDVTDKTPFSLPAERSLTNSEMLDGYSDLYDELTTPADEIRKVTEAIRDILSGKEIDYDDPSRRGVRSFAPAGTARMAERQRRAYRARKQTVLKREREGIDRKVGRAFGSVTDATWEFRRETEGREAGYRSKGARKALAAGASQLLEAGREFDRRRQLAGEKRRNRIAGTVEIVDDTDSAGFVDVTPMEEAEIIENVIEETNMEYAPDGLLSPESYIEEKRRLISSLESCLSQPSDTWLAKEAVAEAAQYGVSLDGEVLREVITTMVTFRDTMQKEMEQIANEEVDLKIEFVAQDLRRMKQMADSVSSLAMSAAGESAATLLKQELEGFVLSDSIDDIIEIELERMEQVLAETVAAKEKEYARYQQKERKSPATRGQNSQWNGGIYTEVEVEPSMDNSVGDGYTASQDSSRVEVVSDTEYSEYEQQYKSAQAATMGDAVDMNKDQEDNPAADLVLRVLDVVFFIGEKLFFVLLPDLITGGAKISSRYAQAQKRGRGAVGWDLHTNMKTKNIR